MSLKYAIGDTVRSMRTSKGLTLTALSKIAHISIAHISDIERGQTTAGPDIVECLAKGLGISTSEFIHEIYHYLREVNE